MKYITSVNDVVDLIKDENNFGKIWPSSDNKYPFGLWFRGQIDSSWELTPTVFRRDDNIFLDESGMFTHFQLRLPNYKKICDSSFDWICLMQHYGLPTRILDWTESILTALYFAVLDDKKHNEKDGKLYALNAKRLNYRAISTTQGKYALAFPKIFHCSLRSNMAPVGKLDYLLNMPELNQNKVHTKFLSNLKKRVKSNSKTHIQDIANPIAIYPNRSNERMVLQNSVFTLHGGKIYESTKSNYKRIPAPNKLEDIGKDALLEYYISSDHKVKIRRELFLLGFHQASLFPELENQSQYIKQYWSLKQ